MDLMAIDVRVAGVIVEFIFVWARLRTGVRNSRYNKS